MTEQELKEKIQDWVDDRFGVPNTFNTTLLVDFKNWLIKEAGYVKLAENQTLPKIEYSEIKDTAVAISIDDYAKVLAILKVCIDRAREHGFKKVEV